jgi:hypothetical protein
MPMFFFQCSVLLAASHIVQPRYMVWESMAACCRGLVRAEERRSVLARMGSPQANSQLGPYSRQGGIRASQGHQRSSMGWPVAHKHWLNWTSSGGGCARSVHSMLHKYVAGLRGSAALGAAAAKTCTDLSRHPMHGRPTQALSEPQPSGALL